MSEELLELDREMIWGIDPNKTEENYEKTLVGMSSVMASRGYLVGMFDSARKIGQVVSSGYVKGILLEHPFRIVSETNEADYLEQHDLAGWPCRTIPGARYYRCITD